MTSASNSVFGWILLVLILFPLTLIGGSLVFGLLFGNLIVGIVCGLVLAIIVTWYMYGKFKPKLETE